MSKSQDLPVRKTMCATCPFKPGSKYAYLAAELAASAAAETSRICHQTGSNNAINAKTGKPEHICRGARDIQLTIFSRIGFIEEPTDEAWNKAREKCGMEPQIVKDP